MKHSKFLFTLLMAIVMMAMCPGRAWAQDVCSVTIDETTTGYADIQQALTAATDVPSATLTLLQDAEMTQSLYTTNNNLTIDLNGHTLSAVVGDSHYALGVSDGSLTIRNGRLTSNRLGFWANATLTISDCSISTVGYGISTESATSPATINISNTNITSDHYAIYLTEGSTVNMSGACRFSNSLFAPISAGNGTINIASGYEMVDHNGTLINTFTGIIGSTYVEVRAAGGSESSDVASVTIGETTTNYADIQAAVTAAKAASSATLTLLQDVNLPVNTELTFDAGNVTLDLNGRNITSETASKIVFVYGGSLTITDTSADKNGRIQNTNDKVISVSLGNLTIHAGTFVGHGIALEVNSYAGTISLDGGHFVSTNNPAIMLQCSNSVLANGYAFFKTGTEIELAEVFGPPIGSSENASNDITVKRTSPKATVTTTNGTEEYSNFQSAFSDALAASSATLTLLQDVTLINGTRLTFNAGNVTLDLNGHKIVGSGPSPLYVVTGGSLTITDNSAAKTGLVQNGYQAVYAEGGSLTIHAGTFECISNNSFALYIDNGVNASIDGGRFISQNNAIFTLVPALATGYCYYDTQTNDVLEGSTVHPIYNKNGGIATDITVDVANKVKLGENKINTQCWPVSDFDDFDDQDYDMFTLYKFVAPFDGELIVYTSGDADPSGALFDADLTYLTSNEDIDNENYNFSMQHDVEKDKVYYIGVTNWDDDNLTDYSMTIEIHTNVAELTFQDATRYDNKIFVTAAEFTYQRTFSESQVGTWQAFYVPFQMPIAKLQEAGIDVAAINNFHEYTDEDGAVIQTDLEVKFLRNGTLRENWPYLIRPTSAGEKSIVIENVELAPAFENLISCSSVGSIYNFIGIYEPMTDLCSNGLLFLAGGELCTAANDEQVLKPQRWFLEIDDNYGSQIVGGNSGNDDDDNSGNDDSGNGGSAKIGIRVIGETDAATGVEDISIVTTVMDQQSVSEAIYDLQGRQLSTVGEGINIIRQSNGKVKKVMIIK